MDDLLTEFIAETQESLEALSSVIVSWEADPDDRDRLDAVFRFFHTVKGSCGFLNLPRFERLSHAAEDVLSQIREGGASPDAATISAVLALMDRIGELCAALNAGESVPHENDDALIQALRACLARSQGAPPPPVVIEEPGEGRSARPQGGPRTIRLPLTLIDQLMNGVSDMVLARNELSRKLREAGVDPELDMGFDRLSACVADMRDTISKTRMQRVDRLFMAIPRMVRDLGRDLGKVIELNLEGGDVEMDREMVEMVVDPLTHIVRNSIDHGIETPEERVAAGKAAAGRLSLVARQSGSQIVIEIADDGRGINVDAVVKKVIAGGFMAAQDVARLSDQEKLDLIFTPGLSTAQQVTAISGRGVGMDVVRANVERLGGVISLTNAPGRGLTITLRVPLTLTIIPGLILQAGGQQFAIPRSAVIEILHDNNAMITLSHLSGATVARIRGGRYSVVDLEDVIGLPVEHHGGPRTLLLVRAASGVPYALRVAQVDNHEELVIRPAAPVVMGAGVYAGMTLPDNGCPMLLLDAGGIAQVAGVAGDYDITLSAEPEPLTQPGVAETGRYSALEFIDLTGVRRAVRLSLIDRVEDIPRTSFVSVEGRPFVRTDGRLLPAHQPPAYLDAEGSDNWVTCLRLRDGCRELCYPVDAIVDIVDVPETLDLVLAHPLIAGVALIEDRQIEVIDSFALFAARDDAPLDARAMMPVRCILADDTDGWNREILAPLLRQAGYEPVFGDAAGKDAILVMHEDDMPSPAPAMVPDGAPVIRLRTASAPAGPEDASVCRYDRDAVLAAIAAVARARKSA